MTYLQGLLLMLAGCSVGCGSATPAPPPAPKVVVSAPPPMDPGFPVDFIGWTSSGPVTDDEAGTIRRLFRSKAPDKEGLYPVGTVMIKAHAMKGTGDVFTVLDVRRRVAQGGIDGWEYESFDAVTRKRRAIDPETCQLCHSAAPKDGTYTVFKD